MSLATRLIAVASAPGSLGSEFLGATGAAAGPFSVSIAEPGVATVGDILIAAAFDCANLTMAGGAGGTWHALANTPGGDGIAGFLWKLAQAADLGATFTGGGTFNAGQPVALCVYRGGRVLTKIGNNAATSPPVTYAGFAKDPFSECVLAIFANSSGTPPSAIPTHFTQRGVFTAGGAQLVLADSRLYVDSDPISFSWAGGGRASVSVFEIT